jgi:hypothetical protein
VTATLSALEPLSGWLTAIFPSMLRPLVARQDRQGASTRMAMDSRQAGRRMHVGRGYCGAVELTGRYAVNPNTDVRLYEDTEGRLHYLANLRPAEDAVH